MWLAYPHKMIYLPTPVGFGTTTTKQLGFLCLTSTPLKPRVQLFFLIKGQYYPSVEDDKRNEKKERALC